MTTSEDGLQYYSKIEKIGEGSFGVVYKAADIRTGKLVALKRLCFDTTPEGMLTPAVLREISVMRELDHPNIIRLEEVIFDETNVHLAFEYMYMDLWKYLRELPKNIFMERWLADLVFCLVNNNVISGNDIHLTKDTLKRIVDTQRHIFVALVGKRFRPVGTLYITKRAILHRDMKPSNLLLNTYGAIKIADFGLAREFGMPTRAYTSQVVTQVYRAPELLLGALRYTPAIDMWSIGCIFAEMATKDILFPGQSPTSQLREIFSRLKTPTEDTWKGVSELPHYSVIVFPRYEHDHLDNLLSSYVDPIGIAVIRLLLTYDPAKRATAKELLKHSYYSDVDRSKLPDPDYDGSIRLPPRSWIANLITEDYPSTSDM